MNTVAIIQARLGSTRLPGKALLDIGGQTMLARTVQRVARARTLNGVVVATTTQQADEQIVAEARRLGVSCSRGSEGDVLSRYAQTARECDVDVIVRITSDCPLIDPWIIDLVVAVFHASWPRVDYASNTLVRTYPRGLDAEVFSRHALERADREATLLYQREHVTPYFYEYPELFALLPVMGRLDCNRHRWTVDTSEDLQFVREVYARLGACQEFDWRDVLMLLDDEPSLIDRNRHIRQKALYAS